MSEFMIKDGGVWKPVKQPYVKDGGVWKPAKEVWMKSGGVWVKTYSSWPGFGQGVGHKWRGRFDGSRFGTYNSLSEPIDQRLAAGINYVDYTVAREHAIMSVAANNGTIQIPRAMFSTGAAQLGMTNVELIQKYVADWNAGKEYLVFVNSRTGGKVKIDNTNSTASYQSYSFRITIDAAYAGNVYYVLRNGYGVQDGIISWVEWHHK